MTDGLASADVITVPSMQLDWQAGTLAGREAENQLRLVGDLSGLFGDDAAWRAADPKTPVYEVNVWQPVAAETEGGLFVGVTRVFPGKIGSEYFMTRGHFHAKRNRGELYWTVSGQGVLVLMDEDRRITSERMTPGSIHYIAGGLAHRVANVGDEILTFWAHWPSDAGHDYDSIGQFGFAARVVDVDGCPVLERA